MQTDTRSQSQITKYTRLHHLGHFVIAKWLGLNGIIEFNSLVFLILCSVGNHNLGMRAALNLLPYQLAVISAVFCKASQFTHLRSQLANLTSTQGLYDQHMISWFYFILRFSRAICESYIRINFNRDILILYVKSLLFCGLKTGSR